jgi:hypothetical protein
MGFEVVESTVLKVFKTPIYELAGLADHYYLAETPDSHNSIGWGVGGLELQGTVKITPDELERVGKFILAANVCTNMHTII